MEYIKNVYFCQLHAKHEINGKFSVKYSFTRHIGTPIHLSSVSV